jgi:hypothetical protein
MLGETDAWRSFLSLSHPRRVLPDVHFVSAEQLAPSARVRTDFLGLGLDCTRAPRMNGLLALRANARRNARAADSCAATGLLVHNGWQQDQRMLVSAPRLMSSTPESPSHSRASLSVDRTPRQICRTRSIVVPWRSATEATSLSEMRAIAM